MKKLTVAERRERELRFAAERYSIPYDKLKHLMNRFYSLTPFPQDLYNLSFHLLSSFHFYSFGYSYDT